MKRIILTVCLTIATVCVMAQNTIKLPEPDKIL